MSFNSNDFNKYTNHPLQAFEWGEFRRKTGVKVIRRFADDETKAFAFQLTIHRIPHTPWNIGYIPKGTLPTPKMLQELFAIGRQENCIFIQLEPDIEIDKKDIIEKLQKIYSGQLVLSAKPLFTEYTFMLDLTKSDEELQKNFHPKTRYNIKVAQKHGVVVKEDNSDTAFEEYLRLTQETTTRQKFYAHSQNYHRLMWETLKVQSAESQRDAGGMLDCSIASAKFKVQSEIENNELSAHLLIAEYQKKVLTAWIVFVYKDTLYYPYGASSSENRETMSSNLMMWEAIQFGKKLGLKKFDMWGALSDNPDTKDPWYGFHRFKEGYGPRLTEFIGSFDLIINPILYRGFKIANSLRWALLNLKK